MLGQLLDNRYKVVKVLSAGGFGQTYLAEDTRRPGNPTCVVKHLKPANSDPNLLLIARRLFNSEAEALELLGHHDQIPQLLAYFEDNQEFYLVQKFIEGHLLSAELLLSGQRWQESQVIELLREVLLILEFVHSHGVIHRDIKPDNIIRRDRDNKLVLIDFGSVKQVRTQLATPLKQSSLTVAIGTPEYMPTEQGKGKPRPNSDIYALGIISIQTLTGLHPTQFQEDPDTGEILWEQQVQVSAELAGILNKMVLYHFKDRYQSATEALQDLQQLVVTPEQPLMQIATSSKPTPTEIVNLPIHSLTEIAISPQPLAPPIPESTPVSHQLSQQTSSQTNSPPDSNFSEKYPRRSKSVQLVFTQDKRSKISSRISTTLQKTSPFIVAVMATFTLLILGLHLLHQKPITPSPVVQQLEYRELNTFTDDSLVRAIAISPDGQILASGNEEGKIKLWNLRTGELSQTLNDHSGAVYSLSFSPDGQNLASSSIDTTIKVWKLDTGGLLRTINQHSYPVSSVTISPNGQLLASSSEDGTIKIWELRTGKLIRTISGDSASFSCVDISPDGKIIAAGSEDNTIKIWKLDTGELLYILKGHSKAVKSIDISSDSSILASGSEDETVKIWNLRTGSLIRTLPGYSRAVESIAISPDGQTLASGSQDHMIALWNLQTGEPIRTFFGHNGLVNSITFSPDGQFLASGSWDGTIKIWQINR